MTDTYSRLAFLYNQYHQNELVYRERLVTRAMYDYAKSALQMSIDKLLREGYNCQDGR